ncbi:hypothetical protein JNW91_15840 [Micromonospora sp. STR1_7]|uniref:Uncharacterized protein n=1 Tax=Micromonospora parastrephiae TaxID=2806101 RepID=A0ABS1XVA0_9ACTN|nr:hypothetical protein [Micromonospora parastrephiae]MBM0233207.1 hypothetical protein [Micromonospora parastrephiae]
MRADDFFKDVDTRVWGVDTTKRMFDAQLVVALRRGPVTGHDDVGAAAGLAWLVHDDLERCGTGGTTELTEQEMRDCLLALRAIVGRLGITGFDPPFRDFTTFRNHWVRNGCSGSWQARRDLLDELLDPLHARLTDMETRVFASTLAEPISPRSATGWFRVDAELAELRRHFQIASSEQDYRNVGNDCVIVTEALSAQVYDAKLHLRDGEDEPPVAKTKIRIERYIEHTVPGPENAELRKLARAAVEFAQRVKHSPTATRRDAGIAADTVILLANILRRLE